MESEVPVVPHHLAEMWSEHSGRATLPSLAVHVEPDKTKRDHLGRWLAGGSVDYTRSYRQIVSGIQMNVAEALRQGRLWRDMVEDDILDRMGRFLVEKRGLELSIAKAEVERVSGVWSEFYRQVDSFNGKFPLFFQRRHQLEGSPDEVGECMRAEELGASEGGAAPGEEETQRIEASKEKKEVRGPAKFVIIYTCSRRIARLHKAGGCPWARIQTQDFVKADIVFPDMYNRRCKHCWNNLSEETDTSSPDE